jgi:hypothetical protein
VVGEVGRRLKAILPATWGKVDTGRLRDRKAVNDLMMEYFSMSELDGVIFDIWGNVEAVAYADGDKAAQVRGIIGHALNSGLWDSLLEVVRKERPFVDWPE